MHSTRRRPCLQPHSVVSARGLAAAGLLFKPGDERRRSERAADALGFRKTRGGLVAVRQLQQICGQQPLQMLLSMRLFCSRMARSSGVVPDD